MPSHNGDDRLVPPSEKFSLYVLPSSAVSTIENPLAGTMPAAGVLFAWLRTIVPSPDSALTSTVPRHNCGAAYGVPSSWLTQYCVCSNGTSLWYDGCAT